MISTLESSRAFTPLSWSFPISVDPGDDEREAYRCSLALAQCLPGFSGRCCIMYFISNSDFVFVKVLSTQVCFALVCEHVSESSWTVTLSNTKCVLLLTYFEYFKYKYLTMCFSSTSHTTLVEIFMALWVEYIFFRVDLQYVLVVAVGWYVLKL